MIELSEARAFVLEACSVLPAVRIRTADALGCVATEALVSNQFVPPFANSALDGFAVLARDTIGATLTNPVRLRLIGTIRAGMGPDTSPAAGDAVRIMTGAPMPTGADAIVMVEQSALVADDQVDLFAQVEAGNAVRNAGEDLRPGDLVFPAGDVISAGHLGVLATLGVDEVQVVPRVRVGVMSTGDELVDGPEALAPGQIRDSNRQTLLALVQQAGCVAIDLGRIPDDEAAITEALVAGAKTCDALISTGGVSMGDFDFVKVVLDRIGDVHWMQVAVKPAKPLACGTIPRSQSVESGPASQSDQVSRVPVFGLPGNPVSSVVSFELFARPALRKMMGHRDIDRRRIQAVADEPLVRHPDGKVHVRQVVCTYGDDNSFHVVSAGGAGSHQLSVLVSANAMAVLPDGGSIEFGETVDVLLCD